MNSNHRTNFKLWFAAFIFCLTSSALAEQVHNGGIAQDRPAASPSSSARLFEHINACLTGRPVLSGGQQVVNPSPVIDPSQFGGNAPFVSFEENSSTGDSSDSDVDENEPVASNANGSAGGDAAASTGNQPSKKTASAGALNSGSGSAAKGLIILKSRCTSCHSMKSRDSMASILGGKKPQTEDPGMKAAIKSLLANSEAMADVQAYLNQ